MPPALQKKCSPYLCHPLTHTQLKDNENMVRYIFWKLKLIIKKYLRNLDSALVRIPICEDKSGKDVIVWTQIIICTPIIDLCII